MPTDYVAGGAVSPPRRGVFAYSAPSPSKENLTPVNRRTTEGPITAKRYGEGAQERRGDESEKEKRRRGPRFLP